MKKLIPLLLGGTCVLASCGTGSSTKTETDTVQAPAAADTTAFTITIAALPPQDLPANATPQQLAEFAWAEFFALNWQSSYPSNQKRDSPDTTTWNFTKPDATLAVWETYAHRTELLPNKPYTVLPFDAQPHYSFGKMPLPYPGPAKPSFTLFNNLDENNEIGSCDLYGQVNQPGGNRMVLYQAKVNRAEYDYIGANYNTPAKLQAAADTTAVHIKKYKAYYKGATSSCFAASNNSAAGVLCLPCGGSPAGGGQGQGTIEIKTAWRQLAPAEDAAKFFTRKVIYYRTRGTQVYYDNATFALVGMHIIHKTVNFPDFVFATWEHIDVEKEHMGLSLLDTAGRELPPYMAPYKRLHPIEQVTKYATAAAHRKLKALNPNSVWLNYRLTGVQGTPTGNPSTSNYFLANYVVESDSTLANFHGSGIGTPFDNGVNTLYKGQLLTAGGCQGCHGVTQLKGTDFSFLLDGFRKPVYSPDTDTSLRAKLTRYIQHTARREARVQAIVAKAAPRR
jgi:hypothetical protein